MNDQPKYKNIGDLIADKLPNVRGYAKRCARKSVMESMHRHRCKNQRMKRIAINEARAAADDK